MNEYNTDACFQGDAGVGDCYVQPQCPSGEQMSQTTSMSQCCCPPQQGGQGWRNGNQQCVQCPPPNTGHLLNALES